MSLQVDVAEYGDCVTGGTQLFQDRDEDFFVAFPARIARDEIEPQGSGLLLDQRKRDRVRAAALAAFFEHHEQRSNVDALLLGAPERQARILAAAEGAERRSGEWHE